MKNIPMFLLLIIVGMYISITVSAATTGTVAATVTAQNVSVGVSDGIITYGTLGLSSATTTLASGLNDTQTATNDGNIAEDFNIKGTSTAAWTLAGSVGNNQYMHEFSINSGGGWTALTTNYQSLATNKAQSGTQTFDLRLSTPTATANFTQQNVDVTVQAVAH